MVVLETHGVGVAFAASTPVIEDVSLHLVAGFYGLVGANGSGKTTLLRVLSGELSPDEGWVRREPKGAVLAVCPQEVRACDDGILELGATEEGRARELRGRLALETEALSRWPTLSPGERKRWQIGAALAREPDVLLLDEPTNHLDIEGRALLVGALRRFRGIGVVVSHDRALLGELTRTTIRVHDTRVSVYPGAYAEASVAWEQERRAAEATHAEAKERAAAAAARLADARREQASADRGKSARARMRDKNDRDGRSMGRKQLAAWAEARSGRRVGVRRQELARAEAEVPAFARDRTLGGSVFAAYERPPSPVLFHVDEAELRAGERGPSHPAASEGPAADGPIILTDVRVTIGREDRVRIVGPNGAGKTTLLRALARRGPPEDRVLHLPQELGERDVAELARSLRELEPEVRGRVLSVFAALGSDPERVLRRQRGEEATLSPGEARKLALATALGRHVWALVLDEPTNHLDLPSVERLEAALERYPGAIVLVSHDDAFARACTSRVLSVTGGTVR